jgi:hypothetical protein
LKIIRAGTSAVILVDGMDPAVQAFLSQEEGSVDSVEGHGLEARHDRGTHIRRHFGHLS